VQQAIDLPTACIKFIDMRTVPATRIKHETLALNIIHGQEIVLGSYIARGLARQAGVEVLKGDSVVFNKDPMLALGDLVKEYRKTFGEASNQISREVLLNGGLSQSELNKVFN